MYDPQRAQRNLLQDDHLWDLPSGVSVLLRVGVREQMHVQFGQHDSE